MFKLVCKDIIIVSFRGWKDITRRESARKISKLVKIINPFIQNPLGALYNGTSSVKTSQISETFPVQVVPECHGPSGRHDSLFNITMKEQTSLPAGVLHGKSRNS